MKRDLRMLFAVVSWLLFAGCDGTPRRTQEEVAKRETRVVLDGWDVDTSGFRVNLTKTGPSVDVVDRVRINNRCDFEWTSRGYLRLTKSVAYPEQGSEKAFQNVGPSPGEELVLWKPLQGDIASLDIPTDAQCGWGVMSVILMTKQGQREWTFKP